jgi:hypothetical protein
MTEAERRELLDWACSIFFTMKYLGNRRLEYTLSALDNGIPASLWRIRKRLIETERLGGFIQEPVFRDILYIIMPKGHIHRHRDPNLGEYIQTRFNVFLQVPVEGSRTYYEGELVDAREGHYTMCRSGLDHHWTDPIEGSAPRISLSFGFLVPRPLVLKMYKAPLEVEEEDKPSALQVEMFHTSRMFIELGVAAFYSQHPGSELRELINELPTRTTCR